MSYSPDAKIWYGVATRELELNEAAAARAEGDWFRDDEQPVFRQFFCGDNLVGFGVELLQHDWNDSPEQLDLSALVTRVEELKVVVDPILDELAVAGERGVYIAANYG